MSAAVAGLSALNILALTRWDIEGAQTVVQEQGTASVLVASLFGLIGTLTPVALVAIFFVPLFRVAGRQPARFEYVVMALTAAAAAVFIAPRNVVFLTVALASFVLLLVALYGLIRRRVQGDPEAAKRRQGIRTELERQEEARREERRSERRAFIAFSALVVLGYTLTVDPWLPREQLSMRDGSKVVAYVLSDSDREIVYLTYWRRTVVRLPATQVSHRTVCWKAWSRPIVDLEAEYPECPD